MTPAWQEWRAKLRACRLVLRGCPDAVDAVAPVERARLLALVERAVREPAFAVPFVLEAVTLAATRALAETGDPAAPPNLFRESNGAAFPAHTLLLLHCGVGLATARLAFGAGGQSSGEVAARLDRFLELIGQRTLPAYAPAAIETLGYVLRTFRRRQLAPVLALLSARERRLADYVAHGAGRALYFHPRRLLPLSGTARAAWRQCRRELPAPRDRFFAQKGVIFALIMVTAHRPAVAAALLERDGDEIERLEPWVSGLTSALLVRSLTVPDDPAPARFVEHRPPPPAADRWRRLVAEPGRECLRALRGEPAAELWDDFPSAAMLAAVQR